jgi:hypothetical protein
LDGRQPSIFEYRRNLLRAIRWYTNPYTNSNCHADSYAKHDSHSYWYSYCYCYCYCDTNSYSYRYVHERAQRDTNNYSYAHASTITYTKNSADP